MTGKRESFRGGKGQPYCKADLPMTLLALPPNHAIMAGPRFTLGLALPLLDLQKGTKKEFHRLEKQTEKKLFT